MHLVGLGHAVVHLVGWRAVQSEVLTAGGLGSPHHQHSEEQDGNMGYCSQCQACQGPRRSIYSWCEKKANMPSHRASHRVSMNSLREVFFPTGNIMRPQLPHQGASLPCCPTSSPAAPHRPAVPDGPVSLTLYARTYNNYTRVARIIKRTWPGKMGGVFAYS